MPTSLLLASRHWLSSLKVRIVALAVLTGLLSALGTATVVLRSAEQSIQRVVLTAATEDRERSAKLLGSKVVVLTEALAAVARRVPDAAWADPAALGTFLADSRQFCHMFRCEKQDVMGEATRMIYPSDASFDALIAEAGPALSQHGVLDTELELLRRTGQVFWARMRGRAVSAGDIGAGTIWTIEDITAAREQRERLSYTASHDSLTGLLNRAAFERQLEAATQEAATSPFCALFIDLDRFKVVNDTGGHAAGDALLRDISQVLVNSVRESDTVARLGGDEFAVLLPQCPTEQARAVADKLCAAVQRYELLWSGARLSVGASVGLVPVDGQFTSAADVMRAADSACYEAKKRGRSRVEQFVASDFHAMTQD